MERYVTLMDWNTQYYKNGNPPKLIYIFNTITIKIYFNRVILSTWPNDPKFLMGGQKAKYYRDNFEGEYGDGVFLSNIKIYYTNFKKIVQYLRRINE